MIQQDGDSSTDEASVEASQQEPQKPDRKDPEAVIREVLQKVAEMHESSIADNIVQRCLGRLLSVPRDTLDSGSISDWSSSPAVMRYGDRGDLNLQFIDELAEHDMAGFDDAPPTLVDPDNPPKLDLDQWLVQRESEEDDDQGTIEDYEEAERKRLEEKEAKRKND